MAKKSLLKRSTFIIVGAAVILTLVAYGRAKENQAELQAKAAVDAPNQNADQVKADPANSKKKTGGRYWIGVRCIAPIPKMVRDRAKAPADGDVFVADVVPQGPAAKAGIARLDIILAVDGSPLKKVSDLVAAVDRSQDKPLTLEIFRDGKRQNIELTPQRRPAEFTHKGSLAMPPDSKWQKLGKWFEENQPGTAGRPPLRMRFMHPGIILPPGTKKHPPLPVGMVMSTPADMNQARQSRIEKQLDAVNRQIEKLNQLAEELRQESLLFNEQKQADTKAEDNSRPDKK